MIQKNLLCFIVLFSIVFSGCFWKESKPKVVDGPSKENIRRYLKSEPVAVPELHGQELTQLQQVFGSPSQIRNVLPNRGLHEYQIEIKNHISDDSPYLAVKEIEWTLPSQEGEKGATLFVWLKHENKKFISFHSLIHEEGWEF